MHDLLGAGQRRAPRKSSRIRRGERVRQHHPDFDKLQMRGWKSAEKEGTLPSAAWEQERQWALRMGLTGADSLEDKTIPTFARGELPHFAG